MAIKCPKCQTDNPETQKFCGECATPLQPSKDIEVTETLETPKEELTTGSTFAKRYQIIEELGKGGMGRVYKAHDTKIKEKIALKLIKPEIAKDKKTIERFSNELRLARRIRHKNVCGMFDLGEEKGTHYITMEFVPGEDLRSLIRRIGQLPIGKSISIATQICEGLSEAHRLGVVHRDLKPSNIMIDKEGNARIMDFGIARSLEAKGITGAGVMIGTPEYMSPEQVEGKEVDQRSDIYSLGVILYEMVTGRVPFEGDTPFTIGVKQKSETPKDPKELNAQIPEDLSRVILRCMEKDENIRYQSAEELLSELNNIEKGISSIEKIMVEGKPEAKIISEIKNSIAVLSFVDLSPQKDQEYFCDGMAEELINSLTDVKDLRVVARTSAFSFKGKDIDIREIGSKLNVETVLEGSVRKAGNRLRITAQLINVSDGYHLWSDRYDCELDDVFAIQDEISLKIVDRLKVKLLGKEKEAIVKHQTENMDAYNLYLKGRHFFKKGTFESMKKAIGYYAQAIEIAPNYGQAYSQQSVCYSYLGAFDYLPPKEAFSKAKKAAMKAIEIEDSLSESHYSLGYIRLMYDWDWAGAEREFKRAIELNPNDSEAHYGYAIYFMAIGRIEDAITEGDKAIALDPLSTLLLFFRSIFFLRAGLLEQAREQLQRALELEPNYPDAHWILGHTYILESRYDEGISEIQKALDLSGNNALIYAGLGWSYAVSGQKKEAQRVLEELKERIKQQYVRPYLFAKIHSALDEKDQAFEWLEKAFEEHDIQLALILRDETLENLRSDPRYTELLRKLRLNNKA